MLVQKFHSFICQQGLIRPKTRVLLACSGGPDSVFLLEGLLASGSSLGLTLAVAHVEHGLRKTAGDRDAQFVAELARAKQLPFYLTRLQLNAMKAPRGLEALAREQRYAALERLGQQHGFSQLVTAHHQDDQVETILLRVLQNAAPRFWSGMPAQRVLRKGSSMQLVRPLLSFTKQEIVGYLRGAQMDFCQDETNQNLRFLRNRVRAFLAQLDAEKRQQISAAVLQIGVQAQRLAQLEMRLVQSLFQYAQKHDRKLQIKLHFLKRLPQSLVSRFVEEAVRNLGGSAPRGTIAAVRRLLEPDCPTGKKVLDPRGPSIVRQGPDLICYRNDAGSFR